jgi:hypothetical protein
MPEIADAVMASLEERLRFGPSATEEVQRRLEEYVDSLDRSDAVALLFRQVQAATSDLFQMWVQIAETRNLMEFERALPVLAHGERDARFRVLQLCGADAAQYTSREVEHMTRFAAEIDHCFAPAEVHRAKVGLRRTEIDVWDCVCGKTVPADRDACLDCHADRFGFRSNEWGPQQTKAYLLRRVAVLRDLLVGEQE